MKKKETLIRIILVVLVLANLAAIFINSAMVATDSSKESKSITEKAAPIIVRDYDKKTDAEKKSIVSQLDKLVRELAHSAEFASLGFLTLLLVRNLRRENKSLPTDALITTCFCALYALSDETHQLFVDGRSFELLDLGMDTLGAVAGQLVVCAAIGIVFLAKRPRKAQAE